MSSDIYLSLELPNRILGGPSPFYPDGSISAGGGTVNTSAYEFEVNPYCYAFVTLNLSIACLIVRDPARLTWRRGII